MGRREMRAAARQAKGGSAGGPSGGAGDLLRQAQALQERMQQAQDEVAQLTAEASVGGGMVTAVVSGELQLRSIRIDPQVVDPADVEMLQDLVLAAVNEALARAQKLQQEVMAGVTGGLSLPGLL